MVDASSRYQRIAELSEVAQIIEAARGRKKRQDLAPITDYVAATTHTEQQLVDIWKEELQLDEVGVDDDFFELDGDSLGCMQVLVRIGQIWRVDISIETFFNEPTVRQLAAAIVAAQANADGPARQAP
jgi:acyl carrier protein